MVTHNRDKNVYMNEKKMDKKMYFAYTYIHMYECMLCMFCIHVSIFGAYFE